MGVQFDHPGEHLRHETEVDFVQSFCGYLIPVGGSTHVVDAQPLHDPA
jgi:hypothetical protein